MSPSSSKFAFKTDDNFAKTRSFKNCCCLEIQLSFSFFDMILATMMILTMLGKFSAHLNLL